MASAIAPFSVQSSNPSDIAINYLAPGEKGVPTAAQGNPGDPLDIYETDFAPDNQRNIFRQALQKRLDLSFRKNFQVSNRITVQYAFNIFNVTNTTSLDVPQNQTEIRQSSACSTSAIAAALPTASNSYGLNCQPGSDYDVNYGQIVTSNSTADQQSALTNLDQLPYHTGTGKSVAIPTTLPLGVDSCTSYTSITSTSCPNNGANFGSVTGTIGGNRAITMGLHIVY